jgi:hypothetical protein
VGYTSLVPLQRDRLPVRSHRDEIR